MLTKEYRIPLPMSLDEYRIAQLYMIQKKSRLESTGPGSAVEIIENTPYENGPGGNGQYTKKIYHIGSHLPGWLKAFLPKTALRVEEEAWNAYPYTKTRHTCPFIEKFFIDIETHYLPDHGQTNIFKLSSYERKNVEIDVINPIKDSFPQKEYKKDEDPHFFVSEKTGRGPLQDDWLDEFQHGISEKTIMCAYKLIRVEFKYWGMQSKIEHFIQSGLRNPMLVGHRQAWSWQDEWYGMTMENIRELERQTQLELSKRVNDLNDESEDSTENKRERETSSEESNNRQPLLSSNYQMETSVKHKSISHSSIPSNQEKMLEMRMKDIEQSESDDEDDDFFDALEDLEEGDTYTRPASMSFDRLSEMTVSGILNENTLSEEPLSPTISSEETFFSNTHTIIFVIQGGNISEYELERESRTKDFETFESVFTSACNYCYPGARSSISFELIECPLLSKDVMKQLKQLSITSQTGAQQKGDNHELLSNSFPFSSVPLLIMESPEFYPVVNTMVATINNKYKQIVSTHSSEQTEVYILADCVGGLLAYDALCQVYNDDTISIWSTRSDDPSLNVDSEELDGYSTSSGFEFVVNGMFSFGSPIGLVALKRKLKTGRGPVEPQCGQIYNLFHSFDPMSSRIEPIIDQSFSKFRPAPVPHYQAFPYNDDIIYNYTALYDELTTNEMDQLAPLKHLSMSDESSRKISSVNSTKRKAVYSNEHDDINWWGTKRVDYMLNCPDGLRQFPVSTLLQLCYNSYWESKDVVTFVIWQILNKNYMVPKCPISPGMESFTYLQPKEKWHRKRTKIKIKNMSPNHRANDVISVLGAQQFVYGKFSYGPVDLAALSGEKVDVYIAKRPQLDEWKLIGTGTTDNHGRMMCTIKEQEAGVYSVKMVVRGDHSSVDSNMAVLPPQTQAVLFSIDGSFLASYSLRGIDPKIRGGAVDVVRHWQDLGYLIIYVSSRLLFQKHQVMSWLSEHNFPFGMVSFCEYVSTDFQRHKVDFLKNITKYEHLTIHAAYGSSRDIPVYISTLNLPPQSVFLIGKKAKSKKAETVQWITDGYAAHLHELKKSLISCHSTNNKNILALGSFGVQQQPMKKNLKDNVEETKISIHNDKKLGHLMKSLRPKSIKSGHEK